MSVTFRQGVERWLKFEFPKYYTHFRVMLDSDIYDNRESKDTWKQTKGLKPIYANIYFDTEYLCEVCSIDTESNTRMKVLVALNEYKNKLEKITKIT